MFSKSKQALANEFVEIVSENADDFVRNLKERKKANPLNIWLIGGQQLNQCLMNENLVDQIILTIAPVVLGKGIRLFGDLGQRHRFKMVRTERFPSGMVQIFYDRQE